MLSNDTSPNAVSQIDETPMIDRKQHQEKLVYSHYLNVDNNGGDLSENERMYSDSSSRLDAEASSSSSSNGMDMYLSPHITKDCYGPNVAKYYAANTAIGKEETTFTSLTYDSMSNIALSDLYSFRDEFSILHSDMRPSEAPWLYAVNKQKARELLIGEKRKTAASSSASTSSSSSRAPTKQRSPRFDIISKRIVPRINDKKSASPESDSDQHAKSTVLMKDEIDSLGKIRIDDSYYNFFQGSFRGSKGGVFRVIVLLIVVITLYYYGQNRLHPHRAFSRSQPWQKSGSISTTYTPLSSGENSVVTNTLWTYLAATIRPVSTSTSTSTTSQLRAEKIKSKLRSRKNKLPIKKRIKNAIRAASNGFATLSIKLSKGYFKLFAVTLCMSQVVMFVTARIIF